MYVIGLSADNPKMMEKLELIGRLCYVEVWTLQKAAPNHMKTNCEFTPPKTNMSPKKGLFQ